MHAWQPSWWCYPTTHSQPCFDAFLTLSLPPNLARQCFGGFFFALNSPKHRDISARRWIGCGKYYSEGYLICARTPSRQSNFFVSLSSYTCGPASFLLILGRVWLCCTIPPIKSAKFRRSFVKIPDIFVVIYPEHIKNMHAWATPVPPYQYIPNQEFFIKINKVHVKMLINYYLEHFIRKNAYKLLLSLYSVLISIPFHMYILPRRRSTSYYTPEIASCQVKNARNVIFF